MALAAIIGKSALMKNRQDLDASQAEELLRNAAIAKMRVCLRNDGALRATRKLEVSSPTFIALSLGVHRPIRLSRSKAN